MAIVRRKREQDEGQPRLELSVNGSVCVSADGSCGFLGMGVPPRMIDQKIVSLTHSMKKEAQIRPDTYPSSILAAERFQTQV
jgi:hypothetical protein